MTIKQSPPRRNAMTIARLFAGASFVAGLAAMIIKQQPEKKMMVIISMAFFFAVAVQVVLMSINKNIFRDKMSNPG